MSLEYVGVEEFMKFAAENVEGISIIKYLSTKCINLSFCTPKVACEHFMFSWF